MTGFVVAGLVWSGSGLCRLLVGASIESPADFAVGLESYKEFSIQVYITLECELLQFERKSLRNPTPHQFYRYNKSSALLIPRPGNPPKGTTLGLCHGHRQGSPPRGRRDCSPPGHPQEDPDSEALSPGVPVDPGTAGKAQ